MAGLRPLVTSALSLALAVLFIVLASTVVQNHNGYPFLCFVLFCFAVVPFFLCWRNEDSNSFLDSSSDVDALQLVGLFVGGALIAAGPGLAIVLYHNSVISGGALGLTLLSGVCVLATSATWSYATGGDDGDDFDF